MSDLNIDFLLEETKSAGTVTLQGVSYRLMRVDVMEDFMMFVATTERIGREFKELEAKPASGDPETTTDAVVDINNKFERLRGELRRMIGMMIPDMSEDLLKEKFPKLEQLQKLFSLAVMEIKDSMAESVKKNSNQETIVMAEIGKN